eukprot:865977_1
MSGKLKLEVVIGFAGSVPHGLILHPDDKHIIYPLGSTIVVKNVLKGTQRFLDKGGHDDDVSCLSLSRSGKFLATGQSTHMGFAAKAIVWDLTTGKALHTLQLHKGKVQDLAFSFDEKYLATLGGPDDNKLVIWNVESGEPVCGSPAANDSAHTVRYLKNSNDILVTGGNYNCRVWQFDLPNRKIRPTDCQLGQIKRVINCICIDDNDENMFCGTQSGDLLKINIESKLFKDLGPKRCPPDARVPKKQRPFSMGIKSILLAGDGRVVVGGGDGTVALMDSDMKIKKRMNLE